MKTENPKIKINFLDRIPFLLLFTGIALGAIGAHALKDRLSPHYLDVFNKGVFYQLINGVGLLALSIRNELQHKQNVKFPSWLIFLGTVIFSVSLYILSITEIKGVGAITPIGGVLMIVGWFLLFIKPR